MSTEVDRLLVRIETTQRQFEGQLKSMNASSARSSRRYERDFTQANKRIVSSFRPVGTAMGAIVGGLGTRQVIQYADAWTEAGNKIAAAEQVAGLQARSLSDINDIADETRSGITATVDLYSKLLLATKGVAKSEEEVARATEVVNKAFKAGGAAASEQAAGVLQLGQALSSGFLQGDELRSLRENAPLLVRAIAEEFDTTIGGLKELGAEGKLTSDRVFAAILAGQVNIEAAFVKTDATIGDGFTRVRNALTEYIAVGDESVHATEKLVAALTFMAENLDLVATGAVLLAARGVTPLAIAMAARLAPAATTAALSLQLIATRGGAALVATSALKSSIALLGGPIGIAALAATGLALALINTKTSAERLKEATAGLDGDFTEVHEISAQLKADYRDLEKANRDLAVAQLAGGQAAVEAAIMEVNAINERQKANEAALQENLILKQAELNAAKAVLDEEERAFNGLDTRRLARLLAFTQARAEAEETGRKFTVQQQNALSDTIATMEMTEESIREIQNAYRDLLTNKVASGEALSRQEQEWLDLSNQIRESRQKVEEMNSALVDTASAGNMAAGGLDNAASSAENLGSRAAAATGAMATLISMVPQLNDAARAAGKMAEARAAYNTALDNAINVDQAAEAARVFELATAEIDGSAEAAIDATTALDGYLDQSHLNSLDARARAIETEKNRFADLEAQIIATGASEKDLADLRAAHASNLAGIDTSYADTGGGGGGGSPSGEVATAGNDTIGRLKFEIELIGKTASEVGALTYQYEALTAAKRDGVDLDKVQIETGQTLRQSIDAEAAAIANLTLEAQQYKDQVDFMVNAQNMLTDGLIDAILEGKHFGDVLSDLGKQIAKAALQAALFGQGPMASLFGTVPGVGGGSLLGGLLPFSGGGYTGPGGKYEPKGVVHGGEFVFTKEATSRIGVGNLQKLQLGLRGYANGGFVGSPSQPSLGYSERSPSINVSAATPEVIILDDTDARFAKYLRSPKGRMELSRAGSYNG